MSKHRNQNKKCTVRRRSIILLVSLLSVIALSIGTTLAFIFTNTGTNALRLTPYASQGFAFADNTKEIARR